ncbi:NAD(P)-dependent malic enzyme [Alteribacter natronophilus]|uniref:NAD(P)-dependent malic enzyme n=1 Tax=Alteribacter natronophilus TaxID=2583810 RepID=UPI00110F3FB5|nr:NADP-dependent malic enzyme [Alteribacter natronophilus]TMW73791.1 NADP-dependent malic enzyme [Alteribacter natronophilus]
MTVNISEAVKLHERLNGKIEMTNRASAQSMEDLSLVYTPGVADVCLEIENEPEKVNTLTARGSMIGVVTDGSAVLGLGDIGPKAAMPVMEGKCMLFKEFAGLNAFPICLDEKDPEKLIEIIKSLAPTFAGINLEDISAPRCFEIEERLKEELDIPVFHDDQHGTAIVVLAGLINALKYTGRSRKETKIVINGAGAAGISIAKLLLSAGFVNITLVSLEGIVASGEPWLNSGQEEISHWTNLKNKRGTLDNVIEDTDVFIGVSAAGALRPLQVKRMAERAIIFALANPEPEIYPKDAYESGAEIVATGRSDFPNQVNNLLAFPGIFRGALNAGVSDITENMKLAAAEAIAGMIPDEELKPSCIIPGPLNKGVAEVVADAVGHAAEKGAEQNGGT